MALSSGASRNTIVAIGLQVALDDPEIGVSHESRHV
jgi:hypothetical protein